MATVNFSVPESLKKEFLEVFADENRSAIVADLMRRAIEERRARQGRSAAIQRLKALRERMPSVSEEEFRRAREAGRP